MVKISLSKKRGISDQKRERGRQGQKEGDVRSVNQNPSVRSHSYLVDFLFRTLYIKHLCVQAGEDWGGGEGALALYCSKYSEEF